MGGCFGSIAAKCCDNTMFNSLPLIQPVRYFGSQQRHVRRGGEDMKSKKSRPAVTEERQLLQDEAEEELLVTGGQEQQWEKVFKLGKPAKSPEIRTSSSKSKGRKVPSQFKSYTHAQLLCKWLCDDPWKRRMIQLWKSLQANPANFDNLEEGRGIFDNVPVFAVDACPSQGGGLLYIEDMQICYVYKLNFNKYLKIGELHESSTFEMLNFLLGLFIFKRQLVNLKQVRVINDHFKIRNAKGSNVVAAIHQILRWLQEIRGLEITNNPEDNFTFTVEPGDEPFMKFADSLSKNKPFKRPASWHEVDFVEISKKEVKNVLSDLVNELWDV